MSESSPPGRSSRRTWLAAGAALVIVPVAAFGVWNWMVNDTSEAVPTDEVLADFRSQSSAAPTTAPPPTTAAPTTVPIATADESATTPPSTDPVTTTTEPAPVFELPQPGVYRYATVGFEQIDALGGAYHEYPAETTITVTPEGCGVRLRWDILRERREDWWLCITDAGVELQADSVQFHEFFGRSEEELIECEHPVPVWTSEPGAPNTVEQNCWRVDEAWLPVWDVVGLETVTVDGVEVDAVHLTQTVVDEDEYWERTSIDWYLAANGLPLRATAVKNSNSPTLVGDVVYDEEFEIDLISLEPLT